MPWWVTCKITGLSTGRRLVRYIAAFPLGPVLIAAGLVLAWKGLALSRQQLAHLLSLAPEAQRFSAAVNLSSAQSVFAFILYCILTSLAPEPRRVWPTLTAAPVRYSSIWLGLNSVTLVVATTGLLLLMFPLCMAFRDVYTLSSALNPHHAPPRLLVFVGVFLFVIQSGALGICAWCGTRWVSGILFRAAFLRVLQTILIVGLLIFPAAVIGTPLLISGQIPGFAGYTMGRILSLAPASARLQALLWQVIATVIPIGGAWVLLNQTVSLPPATSSRSLWSSQHATFGGMRMQFLVNTIKRFFRQRPMVLSHALLCGIVLLLALIMGHSPTMQPTVRPLISLIAPYLFVSIPLLSLGQDLSAEWLFRSTPIRRITYLTLNQSGAAILSLLWTAIVVLCAIREPATVEFWYTLGSQTLGLYGIAFIIGGITRIRPTDAAGQIVPSMVFFLLAITLQYSIGSLTNGWGEQGLWIQGSIWLAIFLIAPFIVLGWESRFIWPK